MLEAAVLFQDAGGTQGFLAAAPVRWKVLSGPGTLSCGMSPCFTATCETGVAQAQISSGAAGTTVLAVALGSPKNPGDCPSDMDTDIATITVHFQ
jgi:hypothetical protein